MANNKNEDEEKDFPGYPHYPAKEDILNQPDAERVDVDVENLSRSNTRSAAALAGGSVKNPVPGEQQGEEKEPDETTAETESDVTADDLLALGEQDAGSLENEDLSATGDDLDVPGSEDDDSDEAIGEEDEENNYYSLGGDAHENLEEDQG